LACLPKLSLRKSLLGVGPVRHSKPSKIQGVFGPVRVDRGGAASRLAWGGVGCEPEFEAFPSDYYTGINAASKSLLAGEKETASQLAKRVQDIVGDKAIPADYWKTATVAEVQLLQGNFDAAARLYGEAVLATPLDRGSQETTYRQAQLLLSALDATDEEKAKIAAAFLPIN
jgi:hypothetical protein